MIPVYVVRHGATELNNQTDLSQDRIRGWANVPLADEGREEAHHAAQELQQYGIQVIVSSDLHRAAETAQIIGQTLGVQPQLTPKLRPWNLGDFTGTSTKEALPKIAVFVQEKPDEPVPGGESFNQFKERAFQGLAEAIQQAQGKPLCIVTHHRDERLFKASEALGWPPNHEIDLNIFLQKGDPPGGVYEMNVNPQALAPQGAPQMPAGAPQPGQGVPPGAPGQQVVPAGNQPNPAMQQQMQQAMQQQQLQMKLQQKLQQIEKAIQLLRDDHPRGYRIDIEVDTMVHGDQQVERQDATEFLTSVTEFVTAAGQIVMQAPDFAPLAAKMLQWGVRKFRTGRELESAIDEYADKVTKEAQANQGKPKPPSPEQIKAQTEQKKAQAEIQSKQLEAKSQQANDEREAKLQEMKFTFDKQIKELDVKIKMMEAQLKEREMGAKMAMMEKEHNLKAQHMEQQSAFDSAQMHMKNQEAQANHQRGQVEAETAHRHNMEFADHAHKQRMTQPQLNGGGNEAVR